MSRKTTLQHSSWSEPLSVSIERMGGDSPNAYSLVLGDRKTEAEVELLPNGSGWLRMGGRVVRFFGSKRGDAIQVWSHGRVYEFTIADPRATRGASAARAQVSDLTAPMPGTILRINVAAGDTFAAHQPLVIMESMKMEMTISAPGGGRVKEITCAEGELVDMGAMLVRLDDVGENDGGEDA